ncbi:MAG: alpha/beta hydrolase [Desulfarculaceae bacterium]|nr:alpha/beta hydrolase [Desulfarculaceae bacterium]MCF8048692.1 alpha/beta hydrolase [Desulfarculaceae bacterium]MCF8096417.1 alpha/beta hydrolase [Desulfarculaceae bacterium]MCF8121904.1 alpha/beta hydrolase [Desulfarculaceae bacterium]
MKAALGLLMMGLSLLGCDGFIDRQIFFPEKDYYAQPGDFGLSAQDVWLDAGDGVRLHGWYIPAPGAADVVLFCHGNAGNISHRLENLALMHRAGMAVFIFDYRGYGQSQGKPSEQGMYLDAEAAWRWAQGQAQSQGGQVVIFGRSLGGVAATYLASRQRPAGLILESTFTNLGAMAKSFFPLPGLEGWLKGRFNSLGRAPRVSCPVLMLHGDADDIVPYRLGRELFEALPQPKRFITLRGAGHNDTYVVGGTAYFSRLEKFVNNPLES